MNYVEPATSSPSPTPLPSAAAAKRQKLWLGGGVFVVTLLILIGGYALYQRSQRGDAAGGNDQGIIGTLPFAGDREEARTTSGLSGRSCDHPDRRAIGVMLAGDTINRPMSGFSKADLVFELPVLTSNVTRLLALYQCGEPTDVGSVRSARHDYLLLADGADAIVGHWGGSYHALNRISAGEFQTINALTNPHNAYFRKDHLPAPYNGFTTYERLWNALQKLGYRTTTNFEGYEFKDDIEADKRPAGGTLSIGWPGAFRVHYEYNRETNRYERYWAGTKQIDFEDKQVVAPSVVAIMRATNGLADGPGGYNDVGIEGEGALEVYQDGTVIKGTWKKNRLDPKDPVHFLNEEGKEIIFTRGQVWVMTPDAGIPVTWEVAAALPAS
jgi:hypothetical protein